ncbi:MAG: hypothetical protein U0230_24595 [Polyangiales bacterium]
MNFYGHSVFAAERENRAGFVLGSMLPDFEGMIGARTAGFREESIRQGVAYHHRTDEAFHSAPVFVGLCARGVTELVARGLPRASARAVAHVGVELLFDAYLLATHGGEPAYLESLEAAAPARLGDAIVWTGSGAIAFEGLRRRLVAWGLPHDYGDPGFVATRLERALAPRPRLALGPEGRAIVEAWIADVSPRVREQAAELERTVREGLARVHEAPGAPSSPAPAP